MGTDTPIIKLDGEAPLRKTKIKPFKMGQTPVKNSEFAKFISQTGYVTEAEVLDGLSYSTHKSPKPSKLIKDLRVLSGGEG